MKKSIVVLILLFCFTFSTYSQSYTNYNNDTSRSPYKISWKLDAPWVGVGLGLNVLGLKLIQDKDDLSLEELNDLSKDDVPGIDRFLAGNYSENADKVSYYPFYGSFAVPVIMMVADKNMRSNAGQISVMFVESMATTGALFTITAGVVDRARPLAYNSSVPEGERREAGAQRSFFAGHTAATASASFFAAKIYHDFYPDSAAKPYVWTAAALVPAWVAYLRAEAGKHFLTDNIVGYAVGAASGILIPELHKKKDRSIDVAPTMGIDIEGNEYQGLSLQYSF
ncbi:phosphatase PAP2 family protein [Salinimicrobium tongyeongense]|uniref:Phosphatase PAP2 family protein n=1 Tax=Salinimicrobium tongyeongense TaxID=2809707 RepID=A0ABY6NRL3_9FLAO|nr:phosphatase PAP2 family protein [Salinimicrobium tongyeongense]UZH55123.1 phosphatase PAP2 family protein [Salinimicrobium tongyeongense]